MKFSVSSGELLRSLNIASGVVGNNSVLPILEDYLFQLSDGRLSITASNLETSVITSIEVQLEEDGNIAVPGKMLMETLKALPEQPIQFEVDDANKSITLTSAFGKYKLAGDNPSDYPETPERDNVQTLHLKAEVINKILSKTLFATSNDELRVNMQGVFFQLEERSLTCVATDAHKLVKYSFEIGGNNPVHNFIVPKKGLNILKAAVSNEDEMELSFNNSNAFFKSGNTEVIIRLIDAKYPDYNAVIPYDNPNVMILDRAEFQSSLRRIAIYANKSTNQVVLNISDGSLTISAQDLDFSNEATEQLSCDYTGSPMNIGFNAKFLIEMLGVIGVDQVRFNLSTPNRAGILVPEKQEENENLIMLVMPVMMGN